MKFQNKFFFPEYAFAVAESATDPIPEALVSDGVILVCTTAGTAEVADKSGTVTTWDLAVGDYVPHRVWRLGTASTGVFVGLR